MSNSLGQWLDRVASIKTIVPLAVVVGLFMLLFQILGPKLHGADSLDNWEIHSGRDIYTALEAYQHDGRQFYLLTIPTLDFIFPISYTLLFVTIIFVAAKSGPPTPRSDTVKRLALVPVLTILADFAENTSIIILLVSFPQERPLLEQILPIITTAKWSLVALSIVLIVLVGAIKLLSAKSQTSVQG